METTVSCPASGQTSPPPPGVDHPPSDSSSVSVELPLDQAAPPGDVAPDNGPTEELPEYDSVVAQSGPAEGTDGGGAAVYQNLAQTNKDAEAAREDVLISEAPPAYRQLFGEQKRTARQKLERYRHTEPRNQTLFQSLKERLENNKVASTFVVSGAVLLLLALPVAMMIVGGLNVGMCFRHEIPLYLLIAGFILIADMMFQLSMCIGIKRNGHHKSIYQTLRLCDCLAVFLFIWLLVGTYWVFTISIARANCSPSPSDYVVVNTTVLVDSEGGTQVSVITRPPSPTSSDCSDCENYVYSFTAFVIMFQYVAFLICFVACCSVFFKKYGR